MESGLGLGLGLLTWKKVVNSSGCVAVAAMTMVRPSYSLKPRTWLGLGLGLG